MAEAGGKRLGQDARDFGMALAILVKYYRKTPEFMDAHRVSIYEHGMTGVPGTLVIRAAMHATKTRKWFPEVMELLADAETCRLEMRAALEWSKCIQCSEQGWVLDSEGRMKRCHCWVAQQERVKALGVGSERLSLPPAQESEFEKVSE